MNKYVQLFNLFFRRNAFIKQNVAELWKNPKIQEAQSDFWEWGFKHALLYCLSSARLIESQSIKTRNIARTEIPVTYEALYNSMDEFLKENRSSNGYVYILYDKPEYWISMISKYVNWVKSPWTLEEQLSYIESKKEQFIRDGRPGGDFAYNALFNSNVKQIIDSAPKF